MQTRVCFVLSDASSGVSLCSFSTVIGTPVEIARDSICVVFLISNGVIKMFLKTMGRKKNRHRKTALFARGRLNSIEKIKIKALIDFDISHRDYTLVINFEKQNYFRLKESIRAKDEILGNIEQDRLI